MRYPKLTLAVCLLSAWACTPPSTPPPAGDATAIGTPRPGFKDEVPKGAQTMEGEIGHYGGTMVLAVAGGPKTFNPLLAHDTSSTNLLHDKTYANCWSFDRLKQESIPGLCERFNRSPDGLHYTFTLREGLRWSDGTPLTSDDFKFSYTVITDPALPSSAKDLFRQGKDAQGKDRFPTFTRIDARTFRFDLLQRDVLFHHAAGSIYPVPKHMLEAAYQAGTFGETLRLDTPPKSMVTSGAFVFADYKPGERIVLNRNPYYWKVDPNGNRLPYLDRVVFIVVPDFNVVLLKFRQGETDLLEVRPEDYNLLKRRESRGGYMIKNLGPSLSTSYLMFNQDPRLNSDGEPYVDPIKLAWFQNKGFRKAVSHAIDRRGIVRSVLHGQGEPLWAFFSPGDRQWGNAKVVEYPYDLKRATALLKEAGFERRDGHLIDATGHPVRFTLITNAENAARVGMLNMIREDLTALGMEVRIRPMPFNDVITAIRTTHDYDGLLLGWGSAVPPDPSQSKNVLESAGSGHYWHAHQTTPATEWEARVDTLLAESGRTYDSAERKRKIDEIQYIFSDELPQIQLVVGKSFAAARRRVGNFRPTALRPVTHWNLEQLFIRPKLSNR